MLREIAGARNFLPSRLRKFSTAWLCLLRPFGEVGQIGIERTDQAGNDAQRILDIDRRERLWFGRERSRPRQPRFFFKKIKRSNVESIGPSAAT
jgi:hypothetical protein